MSLLGNIVRSNKKEAGGGAGIITADNALTVNPAGNVQWGATAAGANSPLLHATFINSGGFLTTMTGANLAKYILSIINTDATGFGLTVNGPMEGIRGTSLNGFAVVGVATNSAGGAFVSINNLGVLAESRSATLIQPALLVKKDSTPTNTDERVIEIQRLVSGGNGANGIGCHINWALDTTIGQENILQIGVTLPDATSATKISNFYIDGVDGVTVKRSLLLLGTGAARLNQYGIGTFTGVPAFTLQVDANGNIIEGAAGGAGWGTTGTVATLTGDATLALAGFKFSIANSSDTLFFIDIAGNKSYLAAGDVNAFATSACELNLNGANGLGQINCQDITGALTATLFVDPATEQVLIQAANGLCIQSDTVMLHTFTNWGNGAAAALGTLTNAPAAGDPTKWVPIDDNGTTRYLPAW